MDTLTHEKQIVTVIIAVYNGAETIESSINSVLEQSYKFINNILDQLLRCFDKND